ncbi:MAG: ATP-binding protein [Desulfatibacillum sp.]|nr:ATP-binding protein [Desulfatibacillum sp.]
MGGDTGFTMARVLDLAIKNDFDELGRLCIRVNDFLDVNQLCPRVVYGVNLALEEILTNIFKYGYDDEAREHEIAVHLEVQDSGIAMTIVDDGHQFDVESAPEPDLTTPISERTVGGLGIHLIRNMLNTLNYHRIDDKNVLELSIKGDAACCGAD